MFVFLSFICQYVNRYRWGGEIKNYPTLGINFYLLLCLLINLLTINCTFHDSDKTVIAYDYTYKRKKKNDEIISFTNSAGLNFKVCRWLLSPCASSLCLTTPPQSDICPLKVGHMPPATRHTVLNEFNSLFTFSPDYSYKY